jgi:ATP-dependent DNA helicase RecQ
LVLEAAGVRQGYRRLRRPANQQELVKTLVDRFVERERQDIARIRRVLSLAEHQGCRTAYLLDYFGEALGTCGHCDRCLSEPASKVQPPRFRKPGPQDAEAIRRLRAERHAALQSPRQMARFLCGISSPATSRAKLRKHADFGRLERVPFSEVLALVEKQPNR